MSDLGKHVVRSHRVVNVAMIALIAVALVAAGVVVGAVLLPQSQPSSVSSAASGGMVAISSQTYDGSHSVGVTPQIADAQVLRSAASGIVTRSGCTAGGTAASGTATWSVDGQPLVNLGTSAPLWRDLSSGMKGADVSLLQGELAWLGYSVAGTGTYDTDTRDAVKQLMSDVGGSSSDGSLPLSWVVWLPSGTVAISSCAVNTGDPIISGGELAQLEGGLQSLVLANSPGEGWVASYQGQTAQIDADGRITDPAFLGTVEAGAEYKFYTSTGQGSLSVQVSLAEPQQVLVVPPSSVVVSGPGTGCLVTASGVVDVQIISSSLGQTLVAVTNGTPPTEVAVQPDVGTTCS